MSTEPAVSRPLAGVRVLDLTRLLPGGFLGALLADLGADVVKIEDPAGGDPLRQFAPRTGDTSAASWILGRGKRSLAVDLKDPAGVELFLRLAAGADVIVEGFRPGVVDRLGIGFGAASARNPRIVYASLTGYGSDGPMRDVAGHDIDYVAYAGVLSMTGPPGGPVCPPGVQVGDLGGASLLGMGILAALYAARVTGTGSHVEVAMYDAALAWTSIHAAAYWAGGGQTGPGRSLLGGEFPCYRVYRCADGRFLAVGALEPKFWANFCSGLGAQGEGLLARQVDPAACESVGAIIAGESLAHWVERFAGVDACVAPVLDLAGALANPLALARGMVRDVPVAEGDGRVAPTLASPIRLGGGTAPDLGPPPRLGAHSRVLAREAGYREDEVDALVAAGVLR